MQCAIVGVPPLGGLRGISAKAGTPARSFLPDAPRWERRAQRAPAHHYRCHTVGPSLSHPMNDYPHASYYPRSRCGRPLRPVRWTLYSRNPDPRLGRADGPVHPGRGRSGLSGRTERSVQALRRPAVAAVLRPPADGTLPRGKDLPQARGPQPHRFAQDQQHLGPGPARPPHEKAAGHRRDRRRTTRRGHGHGLRPLRS